MADKLGGIFISEILADNAGGSAIDTDGDGTTNKSDEFIELQNTTGSTLSLDGFQLWSEKNGLLHSFDAGDTIAADGTATVVGNYTGTPPVGYFDAGISEGTNWLPDGEGQKFDSIFLVDTATGEYIVFSYGDPPSTPVLPSGFTGTTQIGAGETIDSNSPNGTAFARDSTGTFVETSPTPDTPNIPCFVEGTEILSENGPIRVENLVPGMQILTMDAGYVSVRGLGRFAPTALEMHRHMSLRPVIFPKGSIGNDGDLSVSGSHRILVKGTDAEILFGNSEVPAPARSFVGHNGVHVACRNEATVYYHVLLDQHEVISAQGSWVESLFLGDLAVKSLENTNDWRFSVDFHPFETRHSQTARAVLKHYEAALLFSRCHKFDQAHSRAA